jgi:hypothetical protein
MTTQLLNKTTLNYNLEISINKPKVMAFKGKYPVGSKIMINNKIIEQVKNFNYFGCDISYNMMMTYKIIYIDFNTCAVQ